MNFLLNHEPQIRLSFMFGVLLVMALWEVFWPRRQRVMTRPQRWIGNFGLIVVDTIAVRLLLPLAAVQYAAGVQQKGWGLLNQLDWSEGLRLVVAILILDFIIYLQHVMFHAVPLLWRLHMVHHADRDLDVTSGLRFHPVEIAISLLIKFSAITLIGASPLAVLIFEVILNATAMFNHSNVFLPLGVDRWLRWITVTPDMHRVHHSVIVRETNSNFGFNLPYWDRLFGTYRDQPKEGHLGMTIGLKQFQGSPVGRLGWMLLAPFRGNLGEYSITSDEPAVKAKKPEFVE